MAYTPNTLTVFEGGLLEGGFKTWIYISTDSLATILTGGYFATAGLMGMGVGDTIWVINQSSPSSAPATQLQCTAVSSVPTGPTGPVTVQQATARATLGPDAKNWTFLGQVIGPAGVTVGPVVWTGSFEQIWFKYFINGYNGAAIGRILCGATTPSTTGLTNGNKLMEDATPNSTSVSVPGIPLAVTVSNIARSGQGWIDGASGVVKRISIIGSEGPFAASSAPVFFTAQSAFDALDGVNALIQQLQMTVYDTITATTVSATTFGGSTKLIAWGRNND